MLDFIEIMCPYCGEMQEIDADGSGGDQTYWQDCQVCCCPILFDLRVSESNCVSVTVKRDDE